MIHAREDYNRIQDPAGKIGEDEPVFLLRAKDNIAPDAVRYWANELERLCGDPKLVNHVRAHADRMEQWAIDNQGKLPDAPRDQLV